MTNSEAKPSPAQPNISKVLLKALTVLEALIGQGGEAGVSELGRTVDLDKATVFRLLSTLVEAGYAERVSNGRYRITPRFTALAGRLSSTHSLMEIALPYLRRLSIEVDETAYLAVVHGDEAVFMDKVDPERALPIHTPLGSRIPLHCGSAAKALLAFQAGDVIERVLARLQPVTPRSITDPDRLLAELSRIRRRGYALGEQEWRVGFSGVGAPVRNAQGLVLASIALSGPAERLTRKRLVELSPIVVQTAGVLSRALGWR